MAKAVVALGGHALLAREDKPSLDREWWRARQASAEVARLAAAGWRLALTHGNGPQVGHILARSAEATSAYPLTQPIAVAQSQGEIGYILQQSLCIELAALGLESQAATLITQVVVDPKDEAFSRPTKPIGPYMDQHEAAVNAAAGIPTVHESERGWRRVVASPKPLRIVEAAAIRSLHDAGTTVIACGGGGIPVFESEAGLTGIDAVVDKDYAAVLLALTLEADLLLILTDVPHVSLHFDRPGQEPIQRMTTAMAERYLKEGHFGEGTMRPKVEAAVQFVAETRKVAVIAAIAEAQRAIEGTAGTRIIP